VPAALLVAACSSTASPDALQTSPPAAVPAATTSAPATPAVAATTSNPSSDLAGHWSGHYSGAYSGTFTLRWRQSGSVLSGTIRISGIGGSAEAIHGTVDGASIKFGTVGNSTHVTYSGSFSGSSMSGTWQVTGSSGSAGGNWSASKS